MLLPLFPETLKKKKKEEKKNCKQQRKGGTKGTTKRESYIPTKLNFIFQV